MPTTALDAVLGNASFPRVHGSSRFSTLFVWLPVIWRTQPTSIDRLGTLFLTNGELTITLYPTRPPTHEATPHLLPDRQTSSEPFGTRTLLGFLRGLLGHHEHVTGELERELRFLETFLFETAVRPSSSKRSVSSGSCRR
jgi:hypothetical protein